ncbi:hypothetical protein E4U13_004904 [Claviceps humidiphila]|uniref:Uncharacterized protein n=1 Tax=Claviceps humidiphila TaxID=1294629 RepID=A0A9P7TVG8_9HYPO|nr:hypothetical protein E4U13_004904 [Claviceps humidiphila]
MPRVKHHHVPSLQGVGTRKNKGICLFKYLSVNVEHDLSIEEVDTIYWFRTDEGLTQPPQTTPSQTNTSKTRSPKTPSPSTELIASLRVLEVGTPQPDPTKQVLAVLVASTGLTYATLDEYDPRPSEESNLGSPDDKVELAHRLGTVGCRQGRPNASPVPGRRP